MKLEPTRKHCFGWGLFFFFFFNFRIWFRADFASMIYYHIFYGFSPSDITEALHSLYYKKIYLSPLYQKIEIRNSKRTYVQQPIHYGVYDRTVVITVRGLWSANSHPKANSNKKIISQIEAAVKGSIFRWIRIKEKGIRPWKLPAESKSIYLQAIWIDLPQKETAKSAKKTTSIFTWSRSQKTTAWIAKKQSVEIRLSNLGLITRNTSTKLASKKTETKTPMSIGDPIEWVRQRIEVELV